MTALDVGVGAADGSSFFAGSPLLAQLPAEGQVARGCWRKPQASAFLPSRQEPQAEPGRVQPAAVLPDPPQFPPS